MMLGERPVFCVQALDDLNQFNDYPLSHFYGQTLAKDMKIPKAKALSLLLEIEKAGHSRPRVMNAILEVSWGVQITQKANLTHSVMVMKVSDL